MGKNKFIIILILIFAGFGLWVGLRKLNQSTNLEQKATYYCPMHPNYTSDHPGLCPICNMSLVKKENSQASTSKVTVKESKEKDSSEILYWTDPMIPGYKADGPGKSPMGMDLVPIYEESSMNNAAVDSVSGYSTVILDHQKAQFMGIKTATVVNKPLIKKIHTYGSVAHDLELYDAELEYIDAWRIFYAFLSRRPVTDDYRADWREYYLKSPSKDRWRSDEKVKAQQRFIKAEYELRHMGLTEEELEKLRKVKYGQLWLQPELLFFDKDQPVWIYAQIFENDLGFITAGQKAVVTIPAYGEVTEGVILNVSPVIDPITRTTRVRVELPNYKGELNINMFVNVDIISELNDFLLVPREAVMDTGIRKIVFVKTEEGIFEPRTVKTGFEGSGMIAVIQGLKEGEVVASSGNFLLDSESRLKASFEEVSEVQNGE